MKHITQALAVVLLLACAIAHGATQNLNAEQGAALNVTLSGASSSLTGRSLRMHVRSKVGNTSTKLVASTADGRLSVASSSTATLSVGADVMAALSISDPTEYWVYDVESYTSASDVRREWSGRFTITRDVTRDTEAGLEDGAAGYVRYDSPQTLTTAQKLQARTNIGAGTGGGGDAAAWGAITGTLSDQTDLQSVLDAKQATDAELTAIAGLTSAADRVPYFTGSGTASLATFTSAGRALVDDADASAQRSTLGLGTAATQSSSAFEAAGAVPTHAALTSSVHGISSYGATLIDDTDASAARSTLGLGTAAVESSSAFAATAHNHAASDVTSGALALARGGTGASLSDPNADRIAFWDDSTGAVDWLTVGSGLSITGTTISASGGGGLTKFTEAESTSSPNATVYVDSLTAAGSATNVDVAIVPKGTGALLSAVPDSLSSGGNKRGTDAVDWQRSRYNAAQVASGQAATISGGSGNTASGQYSVVFGGQSNSATTTGAGAGGTNSTASGFQAFAFGYHTSATANYTVAIGGAATANAESAVCLGRNSTASGQFSWVPGGIYGTTRELRGARAYASDRRASDGDAQIIGQPVRITTSSTSATTLTADAGSVSSANVMVLPNSSACLFVARVAAYSPGAGDAGAWEVRGLIKRGANAAATSIVGTNTVTTIAADAGIGSPTINVTANTTQGAPVISITPADSDSTYWVGDIECVQVL